jgi:ATP-binding cassette, subfamily B, bacterial HlyB/CyaB
MKRHGEHPEPPEYTSIERSFGRTGVDPMPGLDDSLAGLTLLDSTLLLANLDDDLGSSPDPELPVAILRVLVVDQPPRDIPLRVGEITIGRSKQADVELTDASVSRNHARLLIERNRIIVTDLGSSSGTFVDGVRIAAPTPIQTGAVLALGRQRLELLPTFHPAPERMAGMSATGLRLMSDLGHGGMRPRTTLQMPAVKAPPEPAVQTWRTIPPSSADLEVAARAPFLLDLDESDRQTLLAAMQRLDLQPGQVLLAPGQALEFLYIVVSGQLLLFEHGRSTGTVSQGETVGLLGVLRGGLSAFEVGAGEPVTVLWVAAATVQQIVGREPKLARFIERPLEWPGAARFRQLLRDYGIARECAVDLIAAMTWHSAPASTRLAGEGDPVTAIQIVNSGSVAVSKSIDGTSAPFMQLAEGNVFGGPEICADRGYARTYDATTAVELLLIDRTLILEVLHRAPQLATLLEAFRGFGKPSVADIPPPVAPAKYDDDDDDADAPPVSSYKVKGGERRLRRPVFKHVRQHDEMDCGAACLAMVSQAYGRKISLATFRSKVHVTREGASMWSLVRAARDTGFAVTGVHCTLERMIDYQLPAIAITKYHFVVIYEVTKTRVTVGDPGVGLQTMAIDEFKKEFSGMVLFLRPTPMFLKQKASRPGWRKYLALSNGHLRPALEIILVTFLQFVFGLITPLLTQVAFDRVIVNQDTSLLTWLIVGMSAVSVLSIITMSVRAYLTTYIANRFDTVFSALVYRYVMRLPMNFFMVRRVGDILTRFREIQNVRQFITGDALNALIQVTSIGMYIGILFVFNRTLGYVALGLTPLVAIVSVAASKRLRRLMQEGFPPQAKAQGLLVEQLRSLETVKSLGAEVAGRWRWDEAFRNALRARLRVDKTRLVIATVSEGMKQLALTGMTYVAARMAIDSGLSIGTVIAAGMYAEQIFSPVQALAGQWTNLQTVAVGFGRIDDVLTTSAEPSYEAAAQGAHRRLQGDIELRNVWFQYGSDLSPWVLRNVNLSIKRGETVAFVGRSGSGKTTLAQMLNLLYRPTKGSILIDGKDITEVGLGQLRESIGMVMQDSHLFAGTVFENIAFGQDNASLELVMAAARVANAHGFISTMKDGYFAKLKEGGGGLSGGQRQRINLARALFRRPTILVLDEATSALDSESERAIVEAMKVYCRGRTSILIAHRLSTVLHADRIVLLDNGEVVEVGSHRELMTRGGAYVQLFGAQLAL